MRILPRPLHSSIAFHAILLASSLSAATAFGTIFVSPSGADSNPGTKRRPLRTPAAAVKLSRGAASQDQRHIALSTGSYFDTGVLLSAEDSGLVIESEAKKPAVLVGGVPLTGWQKDGELFWAAVLPSGRSWDVRALQVNGRFCPRARLPDTGTLTHLSKFDVPWMSTTGGGWKRKPTTQELSELLYKEGDLPPNLAISNAEVTVFHMWDESVAAITQLDSAKHLLTLSPPLGHPAGAFGVKEYCLWNTREGMTHPGQWYFDRSANRVVYWPLPGQDMRKAAVIVPTQRSIIRVSGATNVVLRNLALEVTTVPLITGGFAAAAFDGAIQLENAHGTQITKVRIRNVAGQGVKALGGGNRLKVDSCDVSSCGAGGIYISGASNVVENSLIHDVGLMFPSAMAIHGGGNDCLLSHNELFGTPYSAIGFGGVRQRIEYNRIRDCMKVLHDGAAIYTFGLKNGVIRGNLARDIADTGGYGASAYYLDEQCENCVVEANVSLNVARPSHNHMATNNIIRDNVFITSGDMRITFPRSTGFELAGNVLLAGGKVLFEGVNHVAVWSRNVVFSRSGAVEGTDLKDYSTTRTVPGVCGDTVCADPQFIDPANLDLRYRSGSPALRLGLTPLNPALAGRQH